MPECLKHCGFDSNNNTSVRKEQVFTPLTTAQPCEIQSVVYLQIRWGKRKKLIHPETIKIHLVCAIQFFSHNQFLKSFFCVFNLHTVKLFTSFPHQSKVRSGGALFCLNWQHSKEGKCENCLPLNLESNQRHWIFYLFLNLFTLSILFIFFSIFICIYFCHCLRFCRCTSKFPLWVAVLFTFCLSPGGMILLTNWPTF